MKDYKKIIKQARQDKTNSILQIMHYDVFSENDRSEYLKIIIANTDNEAIYTYEWMDTAARDEFLDIFPICPICKNPLGKYPAISRKDNKTKICSKCGTREALVIFENHLRSKGGEINA